MNYTTVIWDWNGTLLNDIDLCLQLVNEILNSQKKPSISKEYYLEVFGFPIKDYYETIGVDFSETSFPKMADDFMEKYRSKVDGYDLHENAVSTLEALKSKNIQQFILTAALQEDVEQITSQRKIRKYFTDLYGLDNNLAASKVKRGHALFEAHSVELKSTVMVGDTLHDADVAKSLGIDCALIGNGHQSLARLREIQSETVSVYSDLKAFIANF